MDWHIFALYHINVGVLILEIDFLINFMFELSCLYYYFVKTIILSTLMPCLPTPHLFTDNLSTNSKFNPSTVCADIGYHGGTRRTHFKEWWLQQNTVDNTTTGHLIYQDGRIKEGRYKTQPPMPREDSNFTRNDRGSGPPWSIAGVFLGHFWMRDITAVIA